ncbi:hypothetical protein ACN6TY_18475, partial [Acinetobacter baumannii]
EWVHVQLHQQKGMISLSPPTICNSASATNFKADLIFCLFSYIFLSACSAAKYSPLLGCLL